ncbi:MAG: transposase, partial [Mycoplasmataceae bacterium]|nr:transposase [Mycoplasmataceae bacterium]
LKQEFMLEEYNVKLPIMKKVVKESIEIYNNERPHWSCNMKTPVQMHKQSKLKIKDYKKINRIKASFDTVWKFINFSPINL